MAEPVPWSKPAPMIKSSDTGVYIVYTVTEMPLDEAEAEAHRLRYLSSLLGSDEAAKDALVYSYTHAMSGFAARLTPLQAERLSKQPGVLGVRLSRKMRLH